MGSETARLGPSLAKIGLVVSEKMSEVDIASNWVVKISIEQNNVKARFKTLIRIFYICVIEIN